MAIRTGLLILIGLLSLNTGRGLRAGNPRSFLMIDTLIAGQAIKKADSLYEQGLYTRALTSIGQAQRLFQTAGFPERVLYCLLKKARIQDATGQLADKRNTLRGALAYVASYPTMPPLLATDVPMQLAEVCIAQQQPDSALQLVDQAQRIFGREKVWRRYVYCDILRATAHYYQRDFRKMDASLKRALETARHRLSRQHELYSVIYQLQGVLYDATGDYEKALQTAQYALAFKQNKRLLTAVDSAFVVSLYNNIGAIYFEKGDFDRTIDYYQQALRIAQRRKKTSKAPLVEIYRNIGLAYQKQGRWALALANYQESLHYAPTPSYQPLAFNYLSMGACYIEQKNSVQASLHLKKAKSLFGSSREGLDNYYLQLGNLLALQGQVVRALTAYKRALTESLTHGVSSPLKARIYQKIGEVQLQQKQFEQAAQSVRQGLVATQYIDQSNGNATNQLARVSDRLALLDLLQVDTKIHQQWANASGNRSVKRRELLAADSLNKSLSALLDTLRLSYPWEEARYSLADKASPTYEAGVEVAMQLYELTQQPHYLETAFFYAEKNKATLLLDALTHKITRQASGIPAQVWQQEKQLRIDLTFYTGKLIGASAKNDTSGITLYQQYLFDARRKLEAFTTQLAKTYPAYYQTRYGINVTSVGTVQARLTTARSAFIEYALTPSGIYAFYLTRSSLRVKRIGETTSVQQRLAELRRCLTDERLLTESSTAAFQLFTQAAHDLHRLLIKPVLPVDTASLPRQLTIVPAGYLGYLPFELLLDSIPNDQAKGGTEAGHYSYTTLPYLLRKTGINYAYSATLYATVATRQPDVKPGRYLAFAPSYVNNRYQNQASPIPDRQAPGAAEIPLPASQKEVDQLAAYFSGETLVGPSATKTRFLQQAEGYDLIHLAMHGTASLTDHNQAGLRFSNGQLSMYELTNLRLNARLVVLSGCQTGYGLYQAGEGILSLAYGFMQAGSQSVVMSLWNVEDKSSATLMNLFYRELAAGFTKGEALQRAKLAYLEQGDDLTSHPLFWAGFVVIGDASPLPAPRSSVGGWLLWILVPTGLATLIIGLVARYKTGKDKFLSAR